MIRLALLAALALLAPAASAASLQVTLPATVASSGTEAIVNVEVQLRIEQAECPGGSNGPFLVALAADANRTSGNQVAANFSEAELDFSVSPTEGVQGVTKTESTTLVLSASPSADLNTTVTVTASLSGGECMVPLPMQVQDATATTAVFFPAREGSTDTDMPEEPVPGFEVVVLLGALAALALARRRKA